MALTTVDTQKMKKVAAELDKNYAAINAQLKKMDECMGNLNQLWQGEGAKVYQNAYLQNTQNFLLFAEAINNCSATLTSIGATYGKADTAAAEAIKAKMGGRK